MGVTITKMKFCVPVDLVRVFELSHGTYLGLPVTRGTLPLNGHDSIHHLEKIQRPVLK